MRNGFCFLVERLPDSITINGRSQRIDTRATVAIAVHLKFQESCDDLEKALYATKKLFFGKSYQEVRKSFELKECCELDKSIVEYLSGAPETKSWKELEDSEKGVSDVFFKKPSNIPDFDFKQDSGAIMAAFRQVYGLSLEEVCNLHWWEFLELFSNLPVEGNTFMLKRHIRTMKVDSKDTAERKAEIRKAKDAVKLKDIRSPEKKKADLQAQLNNLSF